MTCSYIVCKDCFEQGNFPKVFQPEDFSAMTLKSILGEKPLSSDKIDDFTEHDNNEMSFEDARLTSTNFCTADKEKLVSAVTEQTQMSDLIDWQSIAENVFKGAYSV